ncbi:uncharacterized protein EHS24_003154 [Apiotrichum porosum]|uniref:Uncharacterized protein n=1 Tax=Apiotrichum porosum TaxID=105984 RepID=A0A427XFU7_9TREE|nr:uncharacterized protein EHS24_003154 [Apiotrichum porosum]RSH77594.1 hypothetical protein EHS24_003154 [Apiotrichum porosum]
MPPQDPLHQPSPAHTNDDNKAEDQPALGSMTRDQKLDRLNSLVTFDESIALSDELFPEVVQHNHDAQSEAQLEVPTPNVHVLETKLAQLEAKLFTIAAHLQALEIQQGPTGNTGPAAQPLPRPDLASL